MVAIKTLLLSSSTMLLSELDNDSRTLSTPIANPQAPVASPPNSDTRLSYRPPAATESCAPRPSTVTSKTTLS